MLSIITDAVHFKVKVLEARQYTFKDKSSQLCKTFHNDLFLNFQWFRVEHSLCHKCVHLFVSLTSYIIDNGLGPFSTCKYWNIVAYILLLINTILFCIICFLYKDFHWFKDLPYLFIFLLSNCLNCLLLNLPYT